MAMRIHPGKQFQSSGQTLLVVNSEKVIDDQVAVVRTRSDMRTVAAADRAAQVYVAGSSKTMACAGSTQSS